MTTSNSEGTQRVSGSELLYVSLGQYRKHPGVQNDPTLGILEKETAGLKVGGPSKVR